MMTVDSFEQLNSNLKPSEKIGKNNLSLLILYS